MLGGLIFLLGVVLGVRFLWFLISGDGDGHIQSLILAAVLMLLGVQSMFMGLQADIISANRKILEDIQYRIRKAETDKKDNL